MPRTRKAAPRPRGRRYRRYRRKNRLTKMVSRTCPIPDRFYTTLKYNDLISFTTSTSPVWHLFNMNSVFDPDATSGSNHQPFGRDQLATLYERYRVYSTSFSVEFINENALTFDAGFILKSTSSTTTLISTAREKPYSKFMILGEQTSNQRRLRGYCNCAKILGVTKERYRVDDHFQAAVASNPPLSPYLHVGVQACNRTGVNTVYCSVTIYYKVCFFQRVPLTQS